MSNSSERSGNNPPQSAPPVYTVYPVSVSPANHPNFINYGFHQANPHAPPPKYEDVISGDYSKWNHQDYAHLPPNIRSTNTTLHCNCDLPQTTTSHTSSPHPQPPAPQKHSKTFSNAAGALVFALFLTGLFIWRISAILS